MTRRKPSHNRQVATLDATDYGATGPAAQARPSKIVAVEGKQVSSVRSEPVLVRRFSCECYLDELWHNDRLTDRQWAAGMRFRGRWIVGARHTTVTALYGERTDRKSTTEGVETERVSARDEITDAIREIGMIGSAIVIAICGEDERRDTETPVLRLALDKLADFWRIDPGYVRG